MKIRDTERDDQYLQCDMKIPVIAVAIHWRDTANITLICCLHSLKGMISLGYKLVKINIQFPLSKS
jgi:hypothetical protein